MKNTQSSHSIAFVGGKGGVGQTSIILNLARAMHHIYKSSLVFDASHSTFELEHLLNFTFSNCLQLTSDNTCNINSVISEAKQNLFILPSCIAHSSDNDLTLKEQYGVINLISGLNTPFDYFFIDIPNNLSKSNFLLASAANEIVLVIDESSTSALGAYLKIQTFSNLYKINDFGVITNRVSSKSQGNALFNKLESKCLESSMSIKLTNYGSLYKDHYVFESADSHTLAYDQYNSSKFARTLTDVAINIDENSYYNYSKGTVELFPKFSHQ